MGTPDITRLIELVADFYLEYAALGLEPGNPEHGEWHKAHHPVPKCAGGEEEIWLLVKHHAQHGVVQSDCYDRCCIFAWEYDYLEGEMLERARYWKAEHGKRHISRQLENPEFVQKLRQPRSEQTRRKMRKPKSESHKQNISKSRIGMKRESFSEEWREKLSKSGRGILWWNNGNENKKCRECPGEGWVRGRLMPRRKSLIQR